MSNNPADFIEFGPSPSEQEPLDTEQVYEVYRQLQAEGDNMATMLFLQDRPNFNAEAFLSWLNEHYPPTPDIPKIVLIPDKSAPFVKPDGGFSGANPYENPTDFDNLGNPTKRGSHAHAEGYFNSRKAPGGPDHDDFRGNKGRKE